MNPIARKISSASSAQESSTLNEFPVAIGISIWNLMLDRSIA